MFVEFHSVVWMYDDNFDKIAYTYFNTGPISELENGTYADRTAPISQENIVWNHGISEIINSLIKNELEINSFDEFDYSPYNCFNETIEFETGKYQIKYLANKIPMVFAIAATKRSIG